MTDYELAVKYHSITIGSYNTWMHYRLIPEQRPVVAPPSVKTNLIEIPGSDGVLDFTEALWNVPHFGMREGQWNFLVCHEAIENYSWDSLWHRLLVETHGRRHQIILMDELTGDSSMDRFYVGRIFLDSWQSDPDRSRVILRYKLEPYRYLTTEDARQRINGVM